MLNKELNVLKKTGEAYGVSIYDVDEFRYISVHHTLNGRVQYICLCDTRNNGLVVSKFKAIACLYTDQISCEVSDDDEDYYGLDLDSLFWFEDRFEEVESDCIC